MRWVDRARRPHTSPEVQRGAECSCPPLSLGPDVASRPVGGAACVVAHVSVIDPAGGVAGCENGLVGFGVRRFLVVRHGETEWNRMGRRQGRLDSPLTENGWRHAETAAGLCAALGADSVFSSPLGRGRVTADVVGSRLSLPVVVVSDLAEIDHGAFAGLTNEEIVARHPGELARRAESKYTWSFPGGESYANADVRAGAALDAVVATGATSPVLVTHEMIGRMLLRTLLRLDPQDAFERSLPHGSVTEVWPSDARATTHTV